jgi:hypothetical protein
VPRSSLTQLEAKADAKIERMLAVASEPDLRAMEAIRRQLVAHEAELQRTPPSLRRTELDEFVAADVETLCRAFVRLMRRGDAEPRPT